MTSFAASIASLASSVQRAAVRSGTVARNMAKLATGVTLHGLRLAVTSEVVRTAALVAGSRTGTASESTSSSKTASKATAAYRSTATHGARSDRVWAGALEGGENSMSVRLHGK